MYKFLLVVFANTRCSYMRCWHHLFINKPFLVKMIIIVTFLAFKMCRCVRCVGVTKRNIYFQVKWGISQHCAINHSEDKEIWLNKPFLTKNGYISHFRQSYSYTLYETLIKSWVLWLKWGVSQVYTISRSEDINIRLFGPFSPKNGCLSHFRYSYRYTYMKH